MMASAGAWVMIEVSGACGVTARAAHALLGPSIDMRGDRLSEVLPGDGLPCKCGVVACVQ